MTFIRKILSYGFHFAFGMHLGFCSVPSQDPFYKEEGTIILVQPQHHAYFEKQLNDLYLERYKVFKEKLGWNIPVQGNKDIDQYDTPQTTYLLYQDRKYGVCGGMRFLPTTEPYMLRDTFSNLMPQGSEFPHDCLIWDLSRFFFNRPWDHEDYKNASRRGTIKLMLSILEFATTFSPKGLVTVTDTRTEEICLRIGLPLKRISRTHDMGDSEAACFFIPADNKLLRKLKKKHAITGPLIWAPLPIDLSHLSQSSRKLLSKL